MLFVVLGLFALCLLIGVAAENVSVSPYGLANGRPNKEAKI